MHTQILFIFLHFNFSQYAHTKVYLEDADGYNTPMSLLTAGIIATIPGAPISMPFDVIKTRLQVLPAKITKNLKIIA